MEIYAVVRLLRVASGYPVEEVLSLHTLQELAVESANEAFPNDARVYVKRMWLNV